MQTIVVEHRDRLARLGSEYIEAALAACGRKLIVVDQTEMKDDLVQDMVDVLTWFCARLYGRRAAKNRAAKAPPLRNPRVDYRPQDRVRSKRGAAKLFCSCENE